MSAAEAAEESNGAPRRQARGRRRMEQILHAAADVFGERGYERTTTNAIAERAGISPGSLYQFFSDKDDIVRALAERYAEELTTAHAHAFDDFDPTPSPDQPSDHLERVVAAVLGPLLEFNLANPGFKVLFARTDMPVELANAVRPVHDTTDERVRRLVGTLFPALPEPEVRRSATVLVQLVRAMVPLIIAAEGDERDRLVADLHGVLTSYLRTLRAA